jgi:hypothetical protein
MILQLDLSYILSYVTGVQSVYLKGDNMAGPVGEFMHIFTARSNICKVKEEKGGWETVVCAYGRDFSTVVGAS